MAEEPKKPASAANKTAAKATKEAATASEKATENKHSRIEAEKKAVDELITKSSSGTDKKKAFEELKKQVANDIIKSRSTDETSRKKSAEELKKKAHEARQRAQVKILGQSYVSDPNDHLERLANSFDTSARRWEMVVYPTLFAFILLAGYGFYLIYHLTHDISVLSQSVTRMAAIVSDSMPRMTDDIRDMTGSVDNMTGEVSEMSNQMTTLTPMSQNLANMTGTMHDMNRSVYGMQRDIGGMNRTVSGGPFGAMNDMMPFSTDSYSDPLPPRPQMQPMVAQPMPRYPSQNTWGQQPPRNAPFQRPAQPAVNKPPVVNEEIVKEGVSNTVVKKN